MKFNVYGRVSVGVTMRVDAESADEAIQKAYEEFPGLNGYCGNGGTDRLVGVYGHDCSLDAGYSEPEFDEAEKDD